MYEYFSDCEDLAYSKNKSIPKKDERGTLMCWYAGGPPRDKRSRITQVTNVIKQWPALTIIL